MSKDGISDWFDPLYAAAQNDPSQVPWALMTVTPYLKTWLAQPQKQAQGRSALVVACGLGDDAEALAKAGFNVTAFDISETAIRWAQERFPNSSVTYRVADLFALPTQWHQKFDLVFEFRTIQALPLAVRATAIEKITQLVSPSGQLLVATYLRETETPPDGPPWPLSEQELAHVETLGMEVTHRQDFKKKDSRFAKRVMVEYQWPQNA